MVSVLRLYRIAPKMKDLITVGSCLMDQSMLFGLKT